jgi:hypothetical protein
MGLFAIGRMGIKIEIVFAEKFLLHNLLGIEWQLASHPLQKTEAVKKRLAQWVFAARERFCVFDPCY